LFPINLPWWWENDFIAGKGVVSSKFQEVDVENIMSSHCSGKLQLTGIFSNKGKDCVGTQILVVEFDGRATHNDISGIQSNSVSHPKSRY
jgi:hypothetical protein